MKRWSDERTIEYATTAAFAILTLLGLLNTITNPGLFVRLANGLATIVLGVVTWGLWQESRR